MAFSRWLSRWGLVPDGEPITTPSGLLLAVHQAGAPAMLKIAREDEERRGGRLMAWWDGDGAAKVLARHGEALLLERATGARSLTAMVAAGRDSEASRILCDVARRLHRPRHGAPPELVPLSHWFEALAPAARSHGGILAEADRTARSRTRSRYWPMRPRSSDAVWSSGLSLSQASRRPGISPKARRPISISRLPVSPLPL